MRVDSNEYFAYSAKNSMGGIHKSVGWDIQKNKKGAR